MLGLHTGARIAAAAAITGIAWLGPQAMGVASADSGGSSDSASTEVPSRGGHHVGPTSAGTDSPAPPPRAAQSTRAPAAASAVVTVRSSRSDPTLPKAPVVGLPTVLRTTTPAPRSSAPAIPAASAAPGAASQQALVVAVSGASTPTATAVSAAARPAETLLASATQAHPTVQKLGTFLSALTYKAADWVSGMPGSPVKDLFAGALLLAQRSLTNAGFGIGTGAGDGQQGSGAAFGVGSTRLELRNETTVTMEIWDTNSDPDVLDWTKVATLAPGQSTEATRNVVGTDFDWVVKVDGTPRMLVQAENQWGGAPLVDVSYTNSTYNAASVRAEPERGQSMTFNDDPYSPFALWVWRGHDIDSGSMWQANTKNFVVSIWKVPTYMYWPHKG